MMDKTAKELLIPGAVILLRTPQGEFVLTYGTTLLGATSPPRADTYFRIASNTKTMTAALIMQLAQENKLSLDDPVSKYIRGVPNGDNITIAELLSMRSGLYNYTNAPAISESMDHHPARVWSAAQLLAIAFAHPPNFSPGKAYEYSNTNYVLLGLIIEKVEGKPLAQAMQNRLFEPLRLQHTFLPASTVNTLPTPYSHGYLYGSSSVAIVGTPSYSPQFRAAARAGTLLPRDYTNVNHSFAAAAGGVISTANDLATWIQALVTGRLLNAAYQRRWLDSLRPEDPNKPDGQKYGYGIAGLHWGPNTMYFHGGETAGYNSFIGYDPGNQVTLVIWTNLPVSLDDQPTANALMLKVLDQIYVVSPLSPSGTSAIHTYSTTFPKTENPLSENGNWIEGHAAGANLWGNVQTVSGAAYGVDEPTKFGDPTAILTGTWGPAQTVTATVHINKTPTTKCCHEVELRLRTMISPNKITGYEAYCSVMPNQPYCHIARWNGPSNSYWNFETGTSATYLKEGDVIKATVTGTNPTIVTLYKNDVQILQATDTGAAGGGFGAFGPWTSGNPGIGFFDNYDNNWKDFGLSSFSATDHPPQQNR